MCLWLQAGRSFDFQTLCLTIATSIWSLDKMLWLGNALYHNFRGSCEMSLAPSEVQGSNATLVQITLPRPWKITYGQYVFITVPSIPHTLLGRFQAHPYMIAWSDKDTRGLSKTLTLLIAHQNGFSKTVQLCSAGTRVYLDGPYKDIRPLECFDKVFFIASGVGIVSHLLAIRQLLQAHGEKTSRVRRLSVLWFLENRGKSSDARDK